MTFLSVTDCCHQLGIDAKTLRRWLAQAQLSLQTHPTDGRLKGVSREHLRRLATAHHRSLAALPEEGPAPAPPPEPSPVPPTLVALLCTLSELPAQIAALQQQVAELTRLLEPHGPAPIIPAAPTKPSRTAKRPPTPTRLASRAHERRSARDCFNRIRKYFGLRRTHLRTPSIPSSASHDFRPSHCGRWFACTPGRSQPGSPRRPLS